MYFWIPSLFPTPEERYTAFRFVAFSQIFRRPFRFRTRAPGAKSGKREPFFGFSVPILRVHHGNVTPTFARFRWAYAKNYTYGQGDLHGSDFRGMAVENGNFSTFSTGFSTGRIPKTRFSIYAFSVHITHRSFFVGTPNFSHIYKFHKARFLPPILGLDKPFSKISAKISAKNEKN